MKTSNSVVAEEEGHEFLVYLYNNLQLLQFILKGLLITQHRSSTAFVTNTFFIKLTVEPFPIERPEDKTLVMNVSAQQERTTHQLTSC